MTRSLPKRLWYDTLRVVSRIGSVTLFRIRCYGREHIPAAGGVIVLSNHQSHLDPVLVGLAIDRRLNFLARQSLFRFAPLRWLIHSLDAIPIDRDGSGLSGLKETLRRLKREEMVLIFPEGTRTPDGELHRLKPGFIPVARRSGVPLLPVAIEGAYDAWPRSRGYPRPATITICFGATIQPAEFADLDDEEFLNLASERMEACFHQARQQRQLALGISPARSLPWS